MQNAVTIEGPVTKIGNDAFSRCEALQNITVPSEVKYIGIQAFKNCTALETVELSNGLETIDASAFENCSSLSSITIPASVRAINGNAFQDCSSLTSATVEGDTDFWVNLQYTNDNAKKLTTAKSSAEEAATFLSTTYCSYYWRRGLSS